MKTLAMIGVVVVSVACTGIVHAQQMRVPHSHVLTLDMAKKCVAAARSGAGRSPRR